MVLFLALCLLLSFSLTGCGKNSEQTGGQPEPTEVTITDMAGRQVTIPSKIDSVYSSSPVGSLIMYTVNDEKMIGINYDLYAEEKLFTTEYYQKLPNLGGWYGQGKTGNIEEILKRNPDIILSSGTSQNYIDSANALQEQLGIPVVMVNDSFDKLADTYRFLGGILDEEKRCEKLAAYCEDTVKEAKEIAAKIPAEKKVRVYYAEEKAGLNTDPAGSAHAQLIDIAGGINVADVKMTSGYGRVEVSLEQVIAWNPDLIISCIDNGYADSGSYDKILSNPAWSTIKAVKDKEIYETPTIPFNWFDRPPSVNTVIGLKWCQNLLYPEYAKYDIRKEAKEFYSLFYHYDLTDKDLDKILAKSVRK